MTDKNYDVKTGKVTSNKGNTKNMTGYMAFPEGLPEREVEPEFNSKEEYIKLLRLPTSIGFDRIQEHHSNSALRHSSFPHFNISKLENYYKVEVAIAGYKPEEICVFGFAGVLIVRTNNRIVYTTDNTKQVFNGIAKRHWMRVFNLNTDITVVEDEYDKRLSIKDGLLTVWLKYTPAPIVTTIFHGEEMSKQEARKEYKDDKVTLTTLS